MHFARICSTCKCNEGHLGFMKTQFNASLHGSNLAFLFFCFFVSLFFWFQFCMCPSMFCMCNWVFLWCLSFFACLPVKWKNGKLKRTLYLTHSLVVVSCRDCRAPTGSDRLFGFRSDASRKHVKHTVAKCDHVDCIVLYRLT